MPSVSGQVLFNSVNTSPTTGNVITSGVQIALVNTTSNVGLIIKSDSSGNYVFNNVSAGNYKIVEAFGTTTTLTSPGDFNTATVVGTINPNDPPITAMPSPPAQANIVQSLTPNTIFITVGTLNITGQNFVDAPTQDIPITKLDLSLIGSNILTGANNGTWGSWSVGTAQGTAPATAPYPLNVPGFTYVLPSSSLPGDGQYSVLNMSNYSTFGGNWYNTSDHTTRNETGRYFLAGAAGSAVIFTETMTVKTNTYYVFSGWVMNPVRVLGTIPSQLTIKVTGGSGQVLYQQSLLSIQPQTVLPIWNESSTLFNTGSNTSIKFEMLSTGAVGGGNDYIIDDLVIQEANVNTIMTSNKIVDKSFATIGDTLNYTVALKNVGSSTIQNIIFSDTMPNGTSFVNGSVKINNVAFAGVNPTPPGFTLTSPSTMASGATVTITFSVLVNTLPSPNPTINTGITSYNFVPIAGGATVPQTVLSNSVSTFINYAAASATKTRDLAFVTLGDIITYTIPINTNGSSSLLNVIIKDTIPNGTQFISDTLTVNGILQTGANPSPASGYNIGTLPSNAITTVSFKVKVISVPTPNPIPNSANISFNYIVDPSIPSNISSSANTNIITSQFNAAILSSSKIVNKTFANVGDILTYTIPITNSGNVTANNILFLDTIPNGASFISGTLKQDGVIVSGTPSASGITLPNSIGPLGTTTITFQVRVSTIPSPNPIPNTATASGSFTIDSITIPNRIGITNTNSNTVNTQINNANLGNIIKIVDKSFANCGDTIDYTIAIPNIGNVTAQNIVFKDTIPNGTIFVTNSVTINGVIQNGANPSIGVTIPNIAPGTTTTLQFTVKVQC